MPAQTPCPVPSIDRALSNYVNSREETLAIRKTLSKFLAAGLRPVQNATQNQHLNHECPYGITAVVTDPPGLKGTRKSYLESLRARHAAQTRHRELQASLEQLQARHVVEVPAHIELQIDSEAAQGYISLVRQRRRLAELRIIQTSLDKLLDAQPTDGVRELRTLIRDTVGEQPDLPIERLEKLSQAHDNGMMILRLKKEVLEARSSMDQANSARLEVQSASRGKPSLGGQVFALSRTREEIVEWVQEELAKMEEGSQFIEDASPVKRPTGSSSAIDLASAEAQIRDFYNRYATLRAAAIASHESLQRKLSSDLANLNQPSSCVDPDQKGRETTHSSVVATGLLSHLPTLSRTDVNERSLLQQAVYLQRQITAANEETADSLLRLSGESHLLPSGTKDIGSWEKTATEIGALNRTFTKERLQGSRQELRSITTVVDVCSLQSKVVSSS